MALFLLFLISCVWLPQVAAYPFGRTYLINGGTIDFLVQALLGAGPMSMDTHVAVHPATMTSLIPLL